MPSSTKPGSAAFAGLKRNSRTAWDKVLDLNVKSPFWLVQALLPALRQAGTADDPARIINVGSIDGIHVSRLPVYSYASSKAAIHQLTRVLARELGPQHITFATRLSNTATVRLEP